jgi:hypothetical protein
MIKRIATCAVVATLGGGSVAAPAFAAHTNTKAAAWTAARCATWKSKALKRDHNKPSAKQMVTGNKVLARHGCTIKM